MSDEPTLLKSAAHYRREARRVRAEAARTRHHESKVAMLEIADKYDHIAEYVEERDARRQ